MKITPEYVTPEYVILRDCGVDHGLCKYSFTLWNDIF